MWVKIHYSGKEWKTNTNTKLSLAVFKCVHLLWKALRLNLITVLICKEVSPWMKSDGHRGYCDFVIMSLRKGEQAVNQFKGYSNPWCHIRFSDLPLNTLPLLKNKLQNMFLKWLALHMNPLTSWLYFAYSGLFIPKCKIVHCSNLRWLWLWRRAPLRCLLRMHSLCLAWH